MANEKGTVNLPEVKVSVPLGPDAIPAPVQLPEVKVEGIAAPPVGHVSVMSPDGKLGHVPAEWLVKEGAKKGYTLPPDNTRDPGELDLTPDGQVKVVRKDGTAGTVPLEWYAKDPNAKNYIPASKADVASLQAHKERVNQDLADLGKTGWKELNERHKNDDVQDKEGNYKLIGPGGEAVLVKQKELPTLLQSGFKFKDQNFQSLYDAHIQLGAEQDTKKKVESGFAGYVGSIPGFDWLRRQATSHSDYAPGKAWNIANEVLQETSQATQHKVGTAAGVVAQLATPTGIFGEMKAAQAARAAVLGRLAPEGASLAANMGARVLAGAAEGAIISAPQVLAQAALEGDVKGAAESLLLGAGLGAGFGTLAGLGKGAGRLLSYGAEKVQEARGTKALEGLGATPEVLEALGPKATREDVANFLAKRAQAGGEFAPEKLGQAAPEAARQLGTLDTLARSDFGQYFNILPQGSKAELAERALMGQEGSIGGIAKSLGQKEPLLQTMIDKGLSSKSTPEQMERILLDLSQGKNLEGTVQRLDKVAEPLSTTVLNSTLAKIDGGQLSMFADKGGAKLVQDLSKEINALADKSGNISLSNLRQFIDKVGESVNWRGSADDLVNNLKKQVVSDTSKVLFEAGDAAALKGDAKLATLWAEQKAISDASQKMHQQLMSDIAGGKLNPKLSPIFQAMIEKAGQSSAGVLGHAVGGPVGGLIGVKGGEAAAAAASSLVEKYAGNLENGSKLKNWLLSNRASQAIGSYMTLDALKVAASKTEGVAPYLREISNRAIKTPVMYMSIPDPIKSILGQESTGLSKEQQYRRLSERVASLAGAPELRNQQLSQLLAPVMKDHPELAAQMQQDYEKKIMVLNEILHGKNTKESTPFTKQKPYTPSKAEMKDMEDQLKVALNPYALLDGLKNGKVTSKQVAVASQLNPAILEQIRAEMVKEAYSGKANLTYQQRLSASIVMGQAMDQSLKATPQLQGIYGQAAQQQGGGKPGSGKGHSGAKMNADKLPAAQGTIAQRLMGK